jgi:pimeloyl-ACP methyl ester carboxylesterase
MSTPGPVVKRLKQIMMSPLYSAQWNWLWMVGFAAVFALVVAAAIVRRRSIRARGTLPPKSSSSTPETTTESLLLDELIPDSRFVTANGANIHYVQAGDPLGGDIVLLHGIGASVFIWRFLFPILQARHRVTAFDFAGFGKSSKDVRAGYGLDAQAESIAAALTELGITKAMLVGSSMGGAIALWMARRWPERFDPVVALGPATDSSRVPGIAQHFAATAPFFRHTVNRRTIKIILGYIISNKALITDAVIDRYLEPFRDRGESLRAFVAATAILSDRRLPRGLQGLTSRTLIVAGANDNLVTSGSLSKLQRVLPDASFIDHPTGGHHIMEDEPVWLARKLELFLAGDDVSDAANATASVAKTPSTPV